MRTTNRPGASTEPRGIERYRAISVALPRLPRRAGSGVPKENTMPLSPSHLSHELLGLPWQFLILGLALCLIFSALGFKRVEFSSALVTRHRSPRRRLLFRSFTGTQSKILRCSSPVCSCVWFEAGYISHPSGARSLLPEAARRKHGSRHQSRRPDEGCNSGRSIVSLRSPFLASTAHDVSAGRRNGVGIGTRGHFADVGRPWPRGLRRLAEIRV